MNAAEERKFIEGQVEFQQRSINCFAWKCCVNCLNHVMINQGGGITCLKFKSNPPVEVICAGCPGWDADLPF